MKRTRTKGMGITRSVINEIFMHPPVNAAELRQRLLPVQADGARRVLTEKLRRSLVGEEEYGLFLEIFSQLGIGEERDSLLSVVNDRDNDTLARTLAMTLLAEDDPGYLDAELASVDPEDFSRLADRPLIELMTAAEVDLDAAGDVAAFLRESPEEIQEFLLQRLESCRREAGVSAVAAYGQALRCREIAGLHRAMIDAVVEEGGDDAIDLLVGLSDLAADAQALRRCQGALMRVRTRHIDPEYQARCPVGTAYLASCDGQGAFVLLGSFEKPNSSYTTANLCIRAAADVRDGFVLSRHKRSELKRMMKQLGEGTGCEFVSISLPEAAVIVNEAVERTGALKLSLPADSLTAVRLFQQAGEIETTGERVRRAPGPVALSRMRSLLKKSIYRNWLFDTGDLVSARVRPPSGKRAGEAWFKGAARKLDKPQIRKRLAAMARHMRRWHQWKGEAALSALWASTELQIENDFTGSALVRAVLEKTLVEAETAGAIGDAQVFGAPEVRQYLKSKFFQQLKSPRGKHLALLDFTEVVLSCLDSAIGFIPGERHPRDEAKPLMAYTIARCFQDLISYSEKRRSVDAHLQNVAGALSGVCRLRKKECLEIGAISTLELNLFVEEVCAGCSVACLRAPDQIMAEAFFSPRHPTEACPGKGSSSGRKASRGKREAEQGARSGDRVNGRGERPRRT